MTAVIGTIFLIIVAFVLRPWVQYCRHGTWGVLLFRSHSPSQIARDSLTLFLFILLPVQALIATYWPERLAQLVVLHGLAKERAELLGMLLFFSGLIFFSAAQFNLGASWRIGIDRTAKLGLITDGLYRFCRNPIYLGLLIMAAGYALMIPTLLSIALAVIDYAAIRKHVADEESHLLLMYGDEYRRYASKVGRFLPGLGKLA